MKHCEICGKEVNNTTNVKVAGTNVNVCQNCSKLGKKINDNSNQSYLFKKRKNEQIEENLISNYLDILKKSISKKNINIKQLSKAVNIKESLLNKYFTNKIKPDLKHAKKLEKFFDINLTENITNNQNNDLEKNLILKENEIKFEKQSLGDMLLEKLSKK